MLKNVASQVIGAQMTTVADGSNFTGTVTAYYTGDNGSQTIGSVGSGVCTHKGNGYHSYAPTQGETNYNHIAWTFIGSGAVTVTNQVYPKAYNPADWADGGRLDLLIDAILADTNELQTDDTPAAISALDGKIDTIDGIVDDILVDTGTTLPTDIADIPTVAEFEARTLPSADYVVTTDTIAGVTTVTNLTNAPTNGDLTAAMKASVNAECDTALSDYGANTVVPDAAGTAASLHATTDGLINALNDIAAADVVTALGTGSTLTDCLTATGFSTHNAADVVTALGTGTTLTELPWNSDWDAEVQSEVFDALDAAFDDSTGLTANGALDRLRTIGWIIRNKLAITNSNGNLLLYKDDSTTPAFTVPGALTDDSTTTVRLRIA